jgi:hypothetical protein
VCVTSEATSAMLASRLEARGEKPSPPGSLWLCCSSISFSLSPFLPLSLPLSHAHTFSSRCRALSLSLCVTSEATSARHACVAVGGARGGTSVPTGALKRRERLSAVGFGS